MASFVARGSSSNRFALSAHSMTAHRTMGRIKVNSINVMTTPENKFVMRDLFISRYPGSRVFEFNDAKGGNLMNIKNLAIMTNRVKAYDDNLIVSAIFFSSKSDKIFSRGLDTEGDLSANSYADLIRSAENLSTIIANSKKVTGVVLAGEFGGSALGIFSACKYRLGTVSANFRIAELVDNGSIPYGGLAYHLTNCLPDDKTLAKAFSRYLAVTGKAIGCDALYNLNLLTHVVEHKPLEALVDTIAHCTPEYYTTASQIASSTDNEGIHEIIEVMDIAKDPSIISDLLEGPEWDSVFAVRRVTKPGDDSECADMMAPTNDADMLARASIIRRVFGTSKQPSEAIKVLENIANQFGRDAGSEHAEWAKTILATMNKLDSDCVDAWFQLTDEAETKTLAQCYDLEEKILRKLGR